MIIRFSLLLILGSIANFLLAIVLDRLTISNLADQASQLGSMVLLCAFFLLLLAGLGLLGKLITVSLYDYFSTRQRMERRLLFYTSRINRLNRLFQFKKARLLYFNLQKRKHLLKKNGQKSAAS
ncbi:hypothetical protein [Methyloglobulus sp.]|uniref:hypothetical protein n=1 Tax=Methyloglobulus sp. TaxID=2518622 RepID=UPI003989AB71